MELQTERLGLRLVSTDDINNIHKLHLLPETDRYNTLGIPESIQETEKLVRQWLVGQSVEPPTAYVFYIELTASKQFIGLIGLKMGKPKYDSAEVWFKIHKDFWRNGYATEATIGILDFGFHQLHLHRIEAGCAVENIASAKTLEKVGMKREGMKRKNLPIRGEWKDSYFYSILEEEFNR